MANTSSLIAGSAARARHAEKRAAVLTFLHRAHVATPEVLTALLGTRQCNIYPFVRKLEEARLIRTVLVPDPFFSGSRQGLMLTRYGVEEATRADPEADHVYDIRPESIRDYQFAHDMKVAKLAANWVRQGAQLLETDPIGRRAQRKKIPDAILTVNGERVAIEYERSKKAGRELTTVLSASNTLGIPVLWICATDGIFNLITAEFSKETWPTWTLSNANTSVQSGQQYISPQARSRHCVLMEGDPLLLQSPDCIVEEMKRRRVEFLRDVVNGLKHDGWSWDDVVYSDDVTGAGSHFLLSYGEGMNGRVLIVSCIGDDRWTVGWAYEEMYTPPVEDLPMDFALPSGKHPSISIVHAAVWTALKADILTGR